MLSVCVICASHKVAMSVVLAGCEFSRKCVLPAKKTFFTIQTG